MHEDGIAGVLLSSWPASTLAMAAAVWSASSWMDFGVPPP